MPARCGHNSLLGKEKCLTTIVSAAISSVITASFPSERTFIFSEDTKLKKINIFPFLLAVLLVFSGCSSVKPDDTTAFSATATTTVIVTESTSAFTVTEAPSPLTETQTTTTITQPQTTAVPVSASTSQTETVSEATTPETVISSTAQMGTEAGTKPFWSIFGGGSDNSNKKNTTSRKSENNKNTCLVTIRCETVKNNLSSLKKGKEAFVPKSGIILDKAEVGFQNGESAFDVLKRACRENVCTDNCQYCKKGGISLEYNFTPAFGTYYVEGIHQLYEKDCGSMSGWMFSVNGEFPTEGSSSYTVKPGDEIVFAYTCDMGGDIGNAY